MILEREWKDLVLDGKEKAKKKKRKDNSGPTKVCDTINTVIIY